MIFSYLIYFFMGFFSYFFLLVLVLVGISFLTLMERKVLSYIQVRKGPNKVMYIGLFQPFSDALKLFSKEFFIIFDMFKFYYLFCPLMILLISLMSWAVFPFATNLYSFDLGFLFMFCCLAFGSYPLMMAGWSSGSVYPLLGAMRSCAQVISYEVSFIIIVLSLVFMGESYNLMIFGALLGVSYFFYMIPVFFMFFVSVLAELNRMPFDFIEGESELVSGFNTEYFGLGFSMIFMGEYCSIMFMSFMLVLFFFMGDVDSFTFVIFYLLLVYLIIMVRGALPRMRYDELMYLCWKIFLPMSLAYLFFVLGFKWMMVALILLS